jgi:[ribosomal protein S18]-alanine N-acetyltransferase
MQDVILRACTRDDLETVYRVEQTAFGAEGYSPLVLRQLLDVFGPWFRVAVAADGAVVAYTVGGSQAGGPDAWILSLGVHADHQKRGIGKKLSLDLLERFGAAGIRNVRLTVEPTNHAAIRLYERLDFSTVGFEPEYFGKHGSRNVMLARLSRVG